MEVHSRTSQSSQLPSWEHHISRESIENKFCVVNRHTTQTKKRVKAKPEFIVNLLGKWRWMVIFEIFYPLLNAPGFYWIKGWEGPRVGLNEAGKRKRPAPTGNQISVTHPVTAPYYRLLLLNSKIRETVMGLALRKLTEPEQYPQVWWLNLIDLGRIEIGVRVETMMTGQENKVARKAVARTWL